MPRINRKGGHDHVKVYRPQGARYADGKGEVYAGMRKYPSALQICVGLAAENAMRNFYDEFGEAPQGDFVVEAAVLGAGITAIVIEMEVR